MIIMNNKNMLLLLLLPTNDDDNDNDDDDDDNHGDLGDLDMMLADTQGLLQPPDVSYSHRPLTRKRRKASRRFLRGISRKKVDASPPQPVMVDEENDGDVEDAVDEVIEQLYYPDPIDDFIFNRDRDYRVAEMKLKKSGKWKNEIDSELNQMFPTILMKSKFCHDAIN